MLFSSNCSVSERDCLVVAEQRRIVSQEHFHLQLFDAQLSQHARSLRSSSSSRSVFYQSLFTSHNVHKSDFMLYEIVNSYIFSHYSFDVLASRDSTRIIEVTTVLRVIFEELES